VTASRSHRTAGFTIVEMLVVVAITAALMGLIMTGLRSTKRGAAKTLERNHLRQIGIAWCGYSTSFNNRALPGYLSIQAQAEWKTRYRFADGTVMNPGPDYTVDKTDPAANLAGTWPWRLMPYLSHNLDTVRFKEDQTETVVGDEAETLEMQVQRRPAFGYNALHVGGWWLDGDTSWFGGRYRDIVSDKMVHVEAQSVAAVRRSDRLITFSTAALRGVGVHRPRHRVDDSDGSHLVLPPFLGTSDVWGRPRDDDQQDPTAIEVYGFGPDGTIPDT
jgi:type II secretory pathway pseudopilin PulG